MKRLAALLLGGLLLSQQALAEPANPLIRLATTTSTEQSGLLGWLLPQFTKETGYPVQVMAAGTGQSLKMGENGDADLVMTHAPSAEKKFVEVDGNTVQMGVPQASVDGMKMLIPMGRAGSTEDAANGVFLFCSPDSDYISGQVVSVSGGLSL